MALSHPPCSVWCFSILILYNANWELHHARYGFVLWTIRNELRNSFSNLFYYIRIDVTGNTYGCIGLRKRLRRLMQPYVQGYTGGRVLEGGYFLFGTTVFNPVQQHLLTMFAFDGSEERLKEVKAVLFNYFQQKMDQRLNELWDSGILDQKKLDELRTKHLRTDLK